MRRWLTPACPIPSAGDMDDRDVEPPWVDSPPSPVQVLMPQTERATSLAVLKRLGPKVDALSWIPTNARRVGHWGEPAATQCRPRPSAAWRASATPSRRSARLARSSLASAHAFSPAPMPSRCSLPRRAEARYGRHTTQPRPSRRSQPHRSGCHRRLGEGRPRARSGIPGLPPSPQRSPPWTTARACGSPRAGLSVRSPARLLVSGELPHRLQRAASASCAPADRSQTSTSRRGLKSRCLR
jgi:hypothetical protein